MAADKTIVGLDIGTSWIRTVVGTLSRDGQLMVESIAERPSEGVRNGSIVNMEQTIKVINTVISEAEFRKNARAPIRFSLLPSSNVISPSSEQYAKHSS